MPDEQLSYWDYVAAAWRHRPRLGWLGLMPVNQMALAVLALAGFVNPGFWLLAAGGEIAYLGFLSSNDSFQKVVQGQRLLLKQKGTEERVSRMVANLSGDLRERYRRLVTQCGLILGISTDLDDNALGTLRDLRAGGLNQLLWLFLRLLVSRDAIAASLASVDRKTVEGEVDSIRARLARAEPDSPLARSLQGTLEIQLKRLDNLAKARTSQEVIDAELERIEQQVKLVREESAISGGPEGISARLDAVTSTLADTSKWMDQHAEFFGSLASENLDAGPPPLEQLTAPATTPAPPPPPPARARQKQ